MQDVDIQEIRSGRFVTAHAIGDSPLAERRQVPAPAPLEVIGWESARLSSDPWDRLMAHALGVVGSFVSAPVVLAFSVTPELEVRRCIARLAPSFAGSTRTIAELLRRVQPITPFAPRRAARAGLTVLTARDVSAGLAFGRSVYAESLRRVGLGPPAVAYLRGQRRITAGLTVMPAAHGPELRACELAFLRRVHPFLELAVMLTARAPQRTQPAPLAEHGLTARELEVTALAARGATNAEIARTLVLTPATVKTHLTHVYAKLGVRSRMQLVLLHAVEPALACDVTLRDAAHALDSAATAPLSA